MAYDLEFEKPLAALDKRIQALQKKSERLKPEDQQVLQGLKQELDEKTRDLYEQLTPWQTVHVARHKDRPHAIDYLRAIGEDFFELRGDRTFGENASIVGGPAFIGEERVMFLCQEKGREIRERRTHNAGQPHPEGFRKSQRLMKQAEKFGLPLVCLVDTPGASIALEDEERGQAQAIAANLFTMVQLRVPVIVVVIGEGGSGGALALSLGDRLLMMEYSYYSVSSPESAATILLRDAKYAPDMAEAMNVSARQLHKLGFLDGLVPEPVGGAHHDTRAAAQLLKETVLSHLTELKQYSLEQLMEQRYKKYRSMGSTVDHLQVASLPTA